MNEPVNCPKPSAVYRGRFDRYPDDVWLIWSNKWGCWYRDNAQGYTNDVAHAGLYTRSQAFVYYTDPKYPRSHRDVEPFPLSAVRVMLERRRAAIQKDTADKLARIDLALSGKLSNRPQEQS